MCTIHKLLNLGPKSSEWLRECGIHTKADLEKVGPVQAYKMCKERSYNVSLNLLWALAGALLDIPWKKDRLREEVNPIE